MNSYSIEGVKSGSFNKVYKPKHVGLHLKILRPSTKLRLKKWPRKFSNWCATVSVICISPQLCIAGLEFYLYLKGFFTLRLVAHFGTQTRTIFNSQLEDFTTVVRGS